MRSCLTSYLQRRLALPLERRQNPPGCSQRIGRRIPYVSATNYTLLRIIILHTVAATILLLSSAPRFKKGPVPKALTVTGAGAALYYGNTLYAIRNSRS